MAFKLKDGSGVEHTYDAKAIKVPSATTEGEYELFRQDAVTSVNGKTGDVKTGMVVNFTSINGELSSDVPFADVLAFINANPQNPPYIRFTFDDEGDMWAFDQYSYDSESQAIFVYGGYSTLYNAFGMSIMLMWTSDSIKSADVSTNVPIVFDLDSDDNSVSVRYPSGFIAEEAHTMGIIEIMVTGNIPSMVVIDGEIEAMYSGVSEDDGITLIFTSPYISGERKVVTGAFDTATQTISWSVETEQLIPQGHMVPVHLVIGGESTADATYQEMKTWLGNNESVFLQSGSGIMQLDAANQSSTKIGFISTAMTADGFLMIQAAVDSSDVWSMQYTDCTTGFQYKSPSGKKFRLAVADDGTLSTVEIKS